MDPSLVNAIAALVDYAYPEPWETEWFSLELAENGWEPGLSFQIICSDLTTSSKIQTVWPPRSKDPKLWLRWEPSSGAGFWIRPRKFDPILRDRLILLGPYETKLSSPHRVINLQGLTDACLFAAESQRLVWHNPSKGGASSPLSAHFQSLPIYWGQPKLQRYTIPCCLCKTGSSLWPSATDIQICFSGKRWFGDLVSNSWTCRLGAD